MFWVVRCFTGPHELAAQGKKTTIMDLYESASAEREREGDVKTKRKKRRVKERRSSVFTDPISGVPQWCGIQANPEHYLPYVLNETR